MYLYAGDRLIGWASLPSGSHEMYLNTLSSQGRHELHHMFAQPPDNVWWVLPREHQHAHEQFTTLYSGLAGRSGSAKTSSPATR